MQQFGRLLFLFPCRCRCIIADQSTFTCQSSFFTFPNAFACGNRCVLFYAFALKSTIKANGFMDCIKNQFQIKQTNAKVNSFLRNMAQNTRIIRSSEVWFEQNKKKTFFSFEGFFITFFLFWQKHFYLNIIFQQANKKADNNKLILRKLVSPGHTPSSSEMPFHDFI